MLYSIEPNTGSQAISIITSEDSWRNENDMIRSATIEFTDNDVPMGVVLATNLGKDVDVSFDASYNIRFISVRKTGSGLTY